MLEVAGDKKLFMKKRLENIWYYYKWYILCLILAIVVIGNYFIEKSKVVEADCQIGIVTGQYISEAVRDELGEKISEIWGDTNHDGKSYVKVYLYQYDAETMNAQDTDLFMASAVQLAADLKNKVSLWYLTDNPEFLKEVAPQLVEGHQYKDSPILMETGADVLMNFTILENSPQGQELSDKIFG